MGFFDIFKRNRSDEAIADLILQSEKPSAGWYQAIDRTGTFVGFKCICETCHVEHLIQGLAFFKNPVFKCTCGKVHDLKLYFAANAAANQQDVKDGIKLAPRPTKEEELPKRSLVPRQSNRRFIEVSGWNTAGDGSDYEQASPNTVTFLK